MALTPWATLANLVKTKVQNVLLYVKSNAADEIYPLEVDPATGAIPTAAVGVTDVNIVSDSVGLATEVTLAALAGSAATEATLAGLAAVAATEGTLGTLLTEGTGAEILDRLKGRPVVTFVTHDVTAVNIPTGIFTEVIASMPLVGHKWHISNTTGVPLEFCVGPALSEVPLFVIPEAGLDGPMDVMILNTLRVSLRAVGSNATSGYVCITALG